MHCARLRQPRIPTGVLFWLLLFWLLCCTNASELSPDPCLYTAVAGLPPAANPLELGEEGCFTGLLPGLLSTTYISRLCRRHSRHAASATAAASPAAAPPALQSSSAACHSCHVLC